MGKPQNGNLSSTSNTDSAVYRDAEPRTRQVSSQSSSMGVPHGNICRDFVWGICSKGAQCKYRHELSFEAMKNILKFCHDYQNKSVCTWPGCTYLHTSHDEEKLFLTTGQIPRILLQRYAAMPGNSSCNVYFNKTQGAPSLPPPIIPVVGAPVSSLVQASSLPTMLAPPPPTATITAAQNTPPIFTGSPPVATSTPKQAAEPSTPALALFDTSKPPPVIPAMTTAPKSAVKRSPSDLCDAGQTKIRKAEVSKVEKGSCEKCDHHVLRVHVYQKQEQKLASENEEAACVFHKKSKAFESCRLLLKATVSPEMFNLLDDFIQSPDSTVTPQTSAPISPFDQISSLVTESGPSLQRLFIKNSSELAQKLADATSSFCMDKDVTVSSFLELTENVARKLEGVPIENGFSPINKNTATVVTNGYPNKPVVPAGPLTPTTSTSVASSTAPVAPPAQPVAPPVRAHAATPPQGKTPQVMSPQGMSSQVMYSQGMSPQGMSPQVMSPQVMSSQGMSPQVMSPQGMSSQVMYSQGMSPQVMSSQGMSPQVMSPQVMSSQGMSPQVMSPQVMSSQGMSPQVMSPQGMSSQVMYSQGMSPQVMSSQGMSPQGMSPQVMSPQVMSSQGMSPQVMSPQGMSPQGMSPQVMSPQGMSSQSLKIQPAHPPQGAPKPLALAQHRMQLQNGYTMLPPQGMQRGAHPQNVPPVGVPPSSYTPYQGSVPPLSQWPYYPQYPNNSMNMTQLAPAGLPQQSATKPAMMPLQNGYMNGLPRYLQPQYNSA